MDGKKKKGRNREAMRKKAHDMMEEALQMLDQTDDHFAAAHLDFAIALMYLPRKLDS